MGIFQPPNNYTYVKFGGRTVVRRFENVPSDPSDDVTDSVSSEDDDLFFHLLRTSKTAKVNIAHPTADNSDASKIVFVDDEDDAIAWPTFAFCAAALA